MSTHPLLPRVAAAVSLVDNKDYETALPLLIQLRAEAEAAGLNTSFILYHIAVAADSLGTDPALATEAIIGACAAEELNSYFDLSRNILAQHIEARLVEATGDDVVFLYRLLIRLQRVRTVASLAYARWCLVNDHIDVARRIVFAAASIEIGNPDVERLRAAIAESSSANWMAEMAAALGHVGGVDELTTTEKASIN